ncbi:hypothetical protein H0H87_005162 [Tephrocybe sp. NHM501043]|nr:hypothetical protein H0H87_005162 [Tephrocybe sp. NHM501043]
MVEDTSAAVRYLEEELAEVRAERDAYQAELSHYRQRAAKYISLSEKHGLALRDLERELEKMKRASKGYEDALLGTTEAHNDLESSHIIHIQNSLKDQRTNYEETTDFDRHQAQSDLQKLPTYITVDSSDDIGVNSSGVEIIDSRDDKIVYRVNMHDLAVVNGVGKRARNTPEDDEYRHSRKRFRSVSLELLDLPACDRPNSDNDGGALFGVHRTTPPMEFDRTSTHSTQTTPSLSPTIRRPFTNHDSAKERSLSIRSRSIDETSQRPLQSPKWPEPASTAYSTAVKNN